MFVCDFVRDAVRRAPPIRAWVGVALLSACTGGNIFSPNGPISDRDNPFLSGSDADSEARSEALKFTCDPAVVPKSLNLRRLSRVEYTNTLRLLVQSAANAAVADQVMGSEAVRGALASVPTDGPIQKNRPFGRMDQSVTEEHIQGYYNTSVEIADALVETAERRQLLLGDCSNPDACIDTFIERFGRLVLRHPLTDQERAFYRDTYDVTGSVDVESLRDLIVVFLNAPQFLYEVQTIRAPAAGETMVALSDYELASRLAFLLWRTGPDQSLLSAADRGEFSDEESYRQQVERMLDDPRAADMLRAFAREWLDVSHLGNLDSLRNEPRFVAFAGEDMPSDKLSESMLAELADSFVYHGLTASDTIEGWVLSPYSFARSEELANIYGVSVWDGVQEPPRFPAGERAGLVTRAALLSSATGNTRPIMKGVFLRERVLCDVLGDPDPNAVLVAPEPTSSGTTREIVENLTEQPGSSCAACHGKSINPLGFATEGYDALGRLRATEPIYDETGKLLAELPLDTTSIPRVWSNDESQVKGAAELADQIADSGKVEACLARQLVRFAGSREEDPMLDGCALETVRKTLVDGGSVRDALQALTMAQTFRTRPAE